MNLSGLGSQHSSQVSRIGYVISEDSLENLTLPNYAKCKEMHSGVVK